MRIHERRDVPDHRVLNPNAQKLAVVPVQLWSPPQGLNYELSSSRVPKEYARQISNLWIDKGKIRSRYGTDEIGSSGSNVLQVIKFTTPDNVGFILRLSDDDIEQWNGTSWAQVPGVPALSLTPHDKWAFTAFGSTLILSNGWDGMFEYDVVGGVITKIDEGPACQFLTTFGGRVIASVIRDPEYIPERIQWSEKFDSQDWTGGSGSGFEDLRATPAGFMDAQMGVWPISDYQALVVRRRSIWQMTETGQLIAPYRFSRLYADLGTEAPYSIAAVQGGIVGLMTDDIYAITPSGVERIGTLVKDQILDEIADMNEVTGTFNPLTAEYIMSIGDGTMYRYSFVDKAWSRSVYGRTAVKWVTYNRPSFRGLTIDELVGTFDGLTGTFDELSGSVEDENGFMFVADDYVAVEDPTSAQDEVAGVPTNAPVEIWSAQIHAADPLNRTRLIEVQMEYEAGEAQTLVFEYSYDDGVTWASYSIQSVGVTSGPDIISVRKTFTHHKLMLRVSSSTLGMLTIIAVHAFVVDEARVHH